MKRPILYTKVEEANGKSISNRQTKKPQHLHDAVSKVGATGFEPATTWSQTRCATGLRYAPLLIERCKSTLYF